MIGLRSEARWLLPVFAASFLGTAAFRASVPVVAYYARTELQVSLSLLALLTILFFLARAAVAPVAGSLTDRSRKFYLLTPPLLALNAALILLYTNAGSWGELAALRAGQGAVNGAVWALLQVAVASSAPPKWRGTALAIYFAMGSAGIFAGNAIYAVLAHMGGRTVLAVAAALSAAAAPIIYPSLTYLRSISVEVKPHAVDSGARPREALPLLSTCFLTAFTGSVVMGDPIYVYLNEFVGLSKELATLSLGTTGVLGVLASMPLSALADRRSEKMAAAIALGFVCATPLLIAPSAPPIVFSGLLTAAIGWKGFTPISRRWAATHFRNSGAIIGLTNTAMNVGTILGVFAFSGAYDLLQGVIVALGGLQLSAAPLVIAAAAPALAASATRMLKGS